LGFGVVGVDGLGLGVGLEVLGAGVDDVLVDEGGAAAVVPVVVLGAGTVADGASLGAEGAVLDGALTAAVLDPLLPPRESPPHPDSAVATASAPDTRMVVERSRFWCMVSLSSAHAGTPARTEPHSW